MARPPFGWLFAGAWGALWGSFFNVCIVRIGLYESIIRPRSRCPTCGRAVAALENIPILSWLLLGARCRGCRAPISLRYPIGEALSLGLALLAYAHVRELPLGELAGRFFAEFFFAGTLFVLAGIDFDHKLIPDEITYPAIPMFFVAAILLGEAPPLELVAGPFVGYGIIALLIEGWYACFGVEPMGYGDAKLLALIGAFLGWRAVVISFFLAPFIGLVVVVPVLIARRGKVFGVEIPYGPYLVAAAWAYLFWLRGQQIGGLVL